MPDIFIPADTSYYSNYYANLLRKSILSDFMSDYTDKNRELLKSKYSKYETFEKEYNVEQALIDSLIEFAAKRGLVYNEEEYKRSSEEIKIVLKALAARTIFGTNGYYKVVNNSYDPAYRKAIEVIMKELNSTSNP